ALRDTPGPAVQAGSIGEGAGAYDALPRFDTPDLCPHLDDDADKLVSKHGAMLEARRQPPKRQEIGAADGRLPNPHEAALRLLDPRIGWALPAHILNPCKTHRLHLALPSCNCSRSGLAPLSTRGVALPFLQAGSYTPVYQLQVTACVHARCGEAWP